MNALATLGDAPTMAIAVVALLLGLLFAARGPRDKRGTTDDEAPAGPALLTSVPVAAPAEEPEVEPGFVGPQGEIVGHGAIRLGSPSLLGSAAPAEPATPAWAAPPAAETAAPTPVVDAAPAAPAEPAPPGEAAESAFPGQPEAPAAPQTPEPAPAEPDEPAWRRHMPKPAGFRHGGIKLGGKPAGKPPTD